MISTGAWLSKLIVWDFATSSRSKNEKDLGNLVNRLLMSEATRVSFSQLWGNPKVSVRGLMVAATQLGKPKRRKLVLISFRKAIFIIPMTTPMELKIVELVMLLFSFPGDSRCFIEHVSTGRSSIHVSESQ